MAESAIVINRDRSGNESRKHQLTLNNIERYVLFMLLNQIKKRFKEDEVIAIMLANCGDYDIPAPIEQVKAILEAIT